MKPKEIKCHWHNIAQETMNPEGRLKQCLDCGGYHFNCEHYIRSNKEIEVADGMERFYRKYGSSYILKHEHLNKLISKK